MSVNIRDYFESRTLISYNQRHAVLVLCSLKDKSKVKLIRESDVKRFKEEIPDAPGMLCFNVKPKFVKGLLDSTSPQQIYCRLNQYFPDETIKQCFYDIWLEDHNIKNRKKSTTEYIEYRRKLKNGMIVKTDREIKRITRGVKLSEAASWSI